MYLPPNGLYFRLIGRESQRVLYSSNTKDPAVGHDVLIPNAEDQLFTLVYGTGDREGTYAVKGKESGKVLFSRADGDPKVGHEEGDGQNDDNFFTFVEGTGGHAGAFRIVCPATETVLYSSLQKTPAVGNADSGKDADDEYFDFVFEDVVVKKVAFDIGAGRTVDVEGVTLGTPQTFTNETSVQVVYDFRLDESATHTSLFAFSDGFPLVAGTAFSAVLPVVVDGKVQAGTTAAKTWHFGLQESFEKRYSGALVVPIALHQTGTAQIDVKHGTAEVPYTITLASKSTGTETETTGLWEGELTWNATYSVTVV